jgi:hypothetical protein
MEAEPKLFRFLDQGGTNSGKRDRAEGFKLTLTVKMVGGSYAAEINKEAGAEWHGRWQ